jgi:transcriptional regulator with XRE-family HTH domain
MIAPVPTLSGSAPRQVACAFGATLRAAREAAGITQEALAELADCDRTYPSLLERGLRQPTIGMMIDIADALRVEPAALVNLTIARLRERGART